MSDTVTRQETETGWRLCVYDPRCLLSKNDALELKFLDGYRVGGGRCPRGSGTNRYNAAVRRVREMFHMLAAPIGALAGLLDVRVSFHPRGAWDDDAGALMATWIVDGLTDAGLWKKDRRVLRWLSVRTVRDENAPPIVVEIERVPS